MTRLQKVPTHFASRARWLPYTSTKSILKPRNGVFEVGKQCSRKRRWIDSGRKASLQLLQLKSTKAFPKLQAVYFLRCLPRELGDCRSRSVRILENDSSSLDNHIKLVAFNVSPWPLHQASSLPIYLPTYSKPERMASVCFQDFQGPRGLNH